MWYMDIHGTSNQLTVNTQPTHPSPPLLRVLWISLSAWGRRWAPDESALPPGSNCWQMGYTLKPIAGDRQFQPRQKNKMPPNKPWIQKLNTQLVGVLSNLKTKGPQTDLSSQGQHIYFQDPPYKPGNETLSVPSFLWLYQTISLHVPTGNWETVSLCLLLFAVCL